MSNGTVTSGKSVWKIWSIFTDTPDFPIGREFRKFLYHFTDSPLSRLYFARRPGNQALKSNCNFIRLVGIPGISLTITQRSPQKEIFMMSISSLSCFADVFPVIVKFTIIRNTSSTQANQLPNRLCLRRLYQQRCLLKNFLFGVPK